MQKNKKVVVKKEVKPKAVKPVAPKYELISFEVLATIPTQMYGNIMPKIAIKAKTIEEAKETLMPAIEALYLTYAEKPRDGSALSFASKASVTAVEKKVDVTPAPAPKPATPAPAPAPKSEADKLDDFVDELKKSPAFTKAENAIKNCMSVEALGMIEDQIQKSEKLTKEEKPVLLTDVLKKRKDLAL